MPMGQQNCPSLAYSGRSAVSGSPSSLQCPVTGWPTLSACFPPLEDSCSSHLDICSQRLPAVMELAGARSASQIASGESRRRLCRDLALPATIYLKHGLSRVRADRPTCFSLTCVVGLVYGLPVTLPAGRGSDSGQAPVYSPILLEISQRIGRRPAIAFLRDPLGRKKRRRSALSDPNLCPLLHIFRGLPRTPGLLSMSILFFSVQVGLPSLPAACAVHVSASMPHTAGVTPCACLLRRGTCGLTILIYG